MLDFLSLPSFFLNVLMLKSILGTNCDVDRLVPLVFPKPGVRWSKMCTGQPGFCLPVAFMLLNVHGGEMACLPF